MKIAMIVVACLAALMLLLVLGPKLVLRVLRPGLEARVAGDHEASDVLMKDLTANLFGVQSKGKAQARGNGALVLTAQGLRFYQVMPERDLSIDLEDVETVELVRSHLGKTVGRELLRVSFSNGGNPDSVAWYVADPLAWRQRIAELRAASERR